MVDFFIRLVSSSWLRVVAARVARTACGGMVEQ